MACGSKHHFDMIKRLRELLYVAFFHCCLQVQLQAGPVAVSACSYSVQGAAPHTAAQLVAGQQLLLAVETRDQYYNLSPVEASRLKAHASGSQGSVSFSSLPGPPGGSASAAATAATSGYAACGWKLLAHCRRGGPCHPGKSMFLIGLSRGA